MLKKILSIVGTSASAGVILAILINLFWENYVMEGASINQAINFKLSMLFFPSLLGMMSQTEPWGSTFWGLVGLNAVLYGFLGFLVTLGHYKNRYFYLLALFTVVVIWGKVFLLA